MNKNKFKIILMYRYINLINIDIYNKINVIKNIEVVVVEDDIVLKMIKFNIISFFTIKFQMNLLSNREFYKYEEGLYLKSNI